METVKEKTVEHTPGPWNTDTTSNVVDCENNGNDDRPICICKGPDADANARLIAATPDLLDALKKMIDGKVTERIHAVHPSKRFCDVCGRNSDEFVHWPKCPVAIAEAAIAKAEGETAS